MRDLGKIIKTNCKTNEQWREERSHSIGASAVGILFGENYFNTPYTLAIKMREELNGIFDYTENEAMQDGHDLEDFVAKKFARQTGYQIIQASSAEYLLRRENIKFMHVSPDRTYWIDQNAPKHGKSAEQNKGLLECKTTNLIIDPNDIPDSWIYQVQTQMGIGGYTHAHIAWLSKRTFDFGYKKIEFDPVIFEAAIIKCEEFWTKCIIGGEDPAPVNASDVVKQFPNHIEGKTLTASADLLETINTIKELQAEKKATEESITALKDIVASAFTDEEAIVDPNTAKVLVTYKTKKGSWRVDSKKLKKDYPEVYTMVANQDADSRTLLIK